MWRCQHFHALWRAGQKRINVPGYFAKIFAKRNNVRVPTSKNQPFVDLHAGYAHESVLGQVKVLGKVSVKCSGHKATRSLVGPAVIWTNEVTNVAGIRTTNPSAPMTATIQKHTYGAIAVAHHDHGGTTQTSGHKISGCCNLCRVGQKNPSTIEDPLHLEPEYLVAYKNVAANQPSLHKHPTIIPGSGISYGHRRASVKYHLLFKLVQLASCGKICCLSSPSSERAIVVFS